MDLILFFRAFYLNPTARENVEIQHPRGSLVAAMNSKTKKFFRARIVDIEPEKGLCLVRNIDDGSLSYVARRDVFQLMPCFCELPEFAVNLKIANIEPIGCSPTTNVHWSSKAMYV